MEKPVRRKASFARYDAEGKQIRGHKSAQSSGSGAGAWMGKGKTIGGREDTIQVETKDGRKYHIPATAAAAAIRATDVQKQMIAKKDLQPSDSGDVDLDLSFDFVSKMERGKKIDNNIQLEKENLTTPSTPPRSDLSDGEKNTTPIPRGMSSTDWGSRQRKKPPTPLSLGRKRESMENGRDLASQFSPDSPTIKATNYDDEPLMIVPISATRRANDAGILSTLDSVTPTAMESNNAAMTNLIHQQRMAASKRQNASQTSLSTKSPGKRKKVPKAEHSSPKKNIFAESSSKLGQKVPFGTNQKANNAQIVRAEESSLFFVDGRSEDVHSKSNGHSTDSDKRTSYTTSSYYHSNESQGRRSRQLSARESIGSSNHSMPASFKTAATQEAESSAGHAAFSNSSPSAQNVLGLLFPADNVPVVPRIETTAPATHTTNSERSDASPMLTQKSTPITPYSPLFSDGGNGDSHGHSSSLSSTGGRTPLTAVSTLFGDRTGEQDGKLKTESTSILRGSTTPNPISSIATEVIREESSLSIERPISVHPSDSIKMQDGHELQPRTSIETDESLPREQMKNLIVNTDPSPRKNQESFDLTDITGTRAKKGPWSQSPLLLESDDQSKNRVSSMIGENDAEMGFGLGLSLLGERDPEKFSKHPQDHSLVENLTVNRAEVSHESSNTIGLDLLPMHTNPKDNKILTKSPSTSSSTFEGFSINVTPAIEKKEGMKTPDHRVDVPSNVVDIEEILAAGNNAESRGRWSSKLWSVTSAFRSPIRSSFDFNNSTQSPPMRALTLVGKNKDGTSKSSSIRRSASREDIKLSLSKQQGKEESPAVDVYHSMPSSSVLNDQATFSNESVTRPAAAMYTEARSSKHVKRASRIQYLKSGGEESHVQVDMEKNNAMERAILDMIKSPRVADSPSGFTPNLEQFVANEDSKRKSWNINTIANSSSSNKDNNNRASWLVPKRQSHTGARDSELYALAANMQNMLSNAGEGGIDQDSAAVEAMLTRSESQEDGLRRRANRRSMDNMPNTPTFIAEGFEENSIENNEEQMSTKFAKNQKTISFHPSKYNAKGVSIAFEEPSVDHQLSQRNHDHHTRLSAYSRPRSGMQFLRNLSTVHGSYDKPENEQEYENSTEKENLYLHYKAGRMSVRHSASLPSRKRISGIFTPSSTNGESSFFSYTGEALQNVKPSQTLFFAGFLFMPWLWFIGGWIVDNDGLFFIEHAKSFGPADEIPSGQDDEISLARSSNSDNPYTSGRISRAGWYRDEVQDQTETGSIILHSEEDLRARKNRISAMLWPDDTVFMNKIRNSGLMEAMRKQTRKGKGMGGALKRQQEKEREYNPSEDESITVQVAQKMFDCSNLDRYVILNRVMALIASLIAFGGLGLAITAVVIHF